MDSIQESETGGYGYSHFKQEELSPSWKDTVFFFPPVYGLDATGTLILPSPTVAALRPRAPAHHQSSPALHSLLAVHFLSSRTLHHPSM